MKIEQAFWTKDNGWAGVLGAALGASASLVFAFGANSALRNSSLLKDIKKAYPLAQIVGCSTAGEILNTDVMDNSIVVTAIQFERSQFRVNAITVDSMEKSRDSGVALSKMFDPKGLKHIFVLSDGLCVNGSELVKGIAMMLPPSVDVTGGLAADGDRFEETTIVYNGELCLKGVVGIGFYGDDLVVGCGSFGGWDPFGPERVVTRSKSNVVYEVDDRPILDLYKEYLGDFAKGLPATGLLFPLSLRDAKDNPRIVRTLLGINEDERSMTFAGDVPEGGYVRFMKANLERLISGAAQAARISSGDTGGQDTQLAILISCVGRKLILGQRTEEEVDEVRSVLGDKARLLGFYSYGEIAPFTPKVRCELHNQTMTITTLSEK